MAGPFKLDITDNLHHDIYPEIDPKTTLNNSCRGKTILVTGGGRGIGKTVAISFAIAGASTIILTSRSASELAAASAEIRTHSASVEVITHVADVTSEESVKDMFDVLVQRKLVLDVLVNNAGFMDKIALIHETEPATWWKAWEINVKGTYLPTHFALKQHCASPAPGPLTIICTSSVGATMVMPGFSAYQPGKAAVNRFVEFVDAEYAQRGVRAFAFHPGNVATKLAYDVLPPERQHILEDTPELGAGLCVWLASQDAADHFKGKYVSATWDVKEMVAAAEAKSADSEVKGRWLTMKMIV